ncbi:MATE efflux family protein 1 [Platanthera guangdongensis]|uniref:MATE efflux family protein 1 n=1 Tax=Platanthera guangdongensis TaxID=2320717 RepID=A0ABR2LCM4_9ASPA
MVLPSRRDRWLRGLVVEFAETAVRHDADWLRTHGFMLLVRVIVVTFCGMMVASLAACQGPTLMAAFQICLQVWLATSLLADGLAVAGQAIIASAFAKEDLQKVRAATSRILQLSIVLGLLLTVLLGVGLEFGAGIFTKDMNVMRQVHLAIPLIAGTQTINSLAFVFDGVNFGASDYTLSAYSVVVVATVSIPSLLFLSDSNGLIGIWIALTIYMTLRTFASIWSFVSFEYFSTSTLPFCCPAAAHPLNNPQPPDLNRQPPPEASPAAPPQTTILFATFRPLHSRPPPSPSPRPIVEASLPVSATVGPKSPPQAAYPHHPKQHPGCFQSKTAQIWSFENHLPERSDRNVYAMTNTEPH